MLFIHLTGVDARPTDSKVRIAVDKIAAYGTAQADHDGSFLSVLEITGIHAPIYVTETADQIDTMIAQARKQALATFN